MVMGTHEARIRNSPIYTVLTAESVLSYLHSMPSINRTLGSPPTQWQAKECGDGNLNLIFVVQGPSGAIVVKQALPYVRMVGESWPLSVRRNFFEHAALVEQARWAPDSVPEVYGIDESMALITMEFLTPHSVLRAELIHARRYPRVGQQLGRFLGRTLFNTSELRLSGSAKKERTSIFLANTAMCQISEDLIFDEPYFAAPRNWHTAPQLDAVAEALRRDTELKLAVQAMKWRFTNQPECLIHGDLHTGSVMVTQDDMRVIDPEFAFYGPMGFDIGVSLANFLMAFVSQPGHAALAGERDEFGSYLLDQLTAIWTTFESTFSTLWHDRASLAGANLYNPRLDPDTPALQERALTQRLAQIWHDALGFAGCEVIRRVVGLAHVADFETIVDPNRRAECERRAIRVARKLLMERSQYPDIAALTALARGCE